MNLTPDQLITIDRHLRKENWLLNEELIAELTDHYVTGISDRMAQGQAFGEALIEVYKGFGWRKGLLKMEEDFQNSQARGNVRAIKTLFLNYFQLPCIGVTLLIFTVFYTLVLLYKVSSGHFSPDWLTYPALLGMCVVYILAFVHLIRNHTLTEKKKRINQGLFMVVQGLSSLFSIGLFSSFFLPITRLITDFPLPLSVALTLFVLFELVITEWLYSDLYTRKKTKTA